MAARRTQPLAHLWKAYPHLSDLFVATGPITLPRVDAAPVAEAVTRIVVGQMLSGAAAKTIYRRLIQARDAAGLSGSWELPADALARAGLSKRKIRTIQAFGEMYALRRAEVEAWRILSYEDLCREVHACWGLSQWSADMLAIFHFRKQDVFPESDGTIVRVRRALNDRHPNQALNPDLARPYRSYLALALWQVADRGLLQ